MNNMVKVLINSVSFKIVGRIDVLLFKRNVINSKLIFVFILIFFLFFGKMKDKRWLYLVFLVFLICLFWLVSVLRFFFLFLFIIIVF